MRAVPYLTVFKYSFIIIITFSVETVTVSSLLSRLSSHFARLGILDIVFRNGIEACPSTGSNDHKASFLLSQIYATLQRCDALGTADTSQVGLSTRQLPDNSMCFSRHLLRVYLQVWHRKLWIENHCHCFSRIKSSPLGWTFVEVEFTNLDNGRAKFNMNTRTTRYGRLAF